MTIQEWYREKYPDRPTDKGRKFEIEDLPYHQIIILQSIYATDHPTPENKSIRMSAFNCQVFLNEVLAKEILKGDHKSMKYLWDYWRNI